jgi:hypothetical protein
VAGAAGFLFAPQISRLLLERTGGRVPRFIEEFDDEEADDLKASQGVLNSKIEDLNDAIDRVSAQIEETSAEEMPLPSEG